MTSGRGGNRQTPAGVTQLREKRARRREQANRLAAIKAETVVREARLAKRKQRERAAKHEAIEDALFETQGRLRRHEKNLQKEIDRVRRRSLFSVGSLALLVITMIATVGTGVVAVALARYAAPANVWMASLWLPIVLAGLIAYWWFDECYSPWRSKEQDLARLQDEHASVGRDRLALDAGIYTVEYHARSRICEITIAD